MEIIVLVCTRMFPLCTHYIVIDGQVLFSGNLSPGAQDALQPRFDFHGDFMAKCLRPRSQANRLCKSKEERKWESAY